MVHIVAHWSKLLLDENDIVNLNPPKQIALHLEKGDLNILGNQRLFQRLHSSEKDDPNRWKLAEIRIFEQKMAYSRV